MSNIDVVAETSEYTVISEYTPLPRQSEAYQSEYQLEQEFINMLSQQGYEYITIRNEKDLICVFSLKNSMITLSQMTNGRDFSTAVSQIQMTALLRKQGEYKRILYKSSNAMTAQPKISILSEKTMCIKIPCRSSISMKSVNPTVQGTTTVMM